LGTFGGDLSDEQESFRRKTEIMSLLLDAGADVNCRDTRRSPLLAAAQKGDETLLEWLQVDSRIRD
jgi:ankyrin repeat protein